jgi:hypothetical protein
MNKLLTLGVAFFILSLAGCASYYSEPSSKKPHAVLTFQEAKGFAGAIGGQAVTPLEINGLAPNEWGKWNFKSFKIEPGLNRLFLIVRGSASVQGTVHLKFEAAAGRTYRVASESMDEYFEVTVTDDQGVKVASGKAEKAAANRSSGAYIPVFIPAK